MLTELCIHNIILIESSTLQFDQGFHIFSGETGAGKTAILQALSLALGARLDPSVIRQGEETGLIEAYFDLPPSSRVYPLLKEAQIEVDLDDPLVIRREIKTTGKSKLLINGSWAPLHVLKKIAPYLVDMVSQHSTQKLFDLEQHRNFLDQFGKHFDLTDQIQSHYQKIQSLSQKIETLQSQEQSREQQQKRWEVDLEELELAKLTSEEEEEHLFQEYEKLSKVNEQIETLLQVTHTLHESDSSLSTRLSAEIKSLSKFTACDSKLDELHERLLNLSEELSDVSFDLMHYRDTLEEDPERLALIEERLRLLNHLKKRYGPSLKEVLQTQEELQKKLSSFQGLSQEIETLQKELYEFKRKYEDLCELLTQKRITAKDALESKALSFFKELNLPHAELLIELKEAYPDQHGNESVEFFLKANIGEKKTSLRDKVSGGELSRVMLTLKLLLSELEETPTLIFDEIDANLGGETAPKIGKLLQKVSESKQVFAITHLPQVAIYGQHHYVIQKKQSESRTHSLVEKLSEKQKIIEIERMLGGKGLSKKAQDLARDLIESKDS